MEPTTAEETSAAQAFYQQGINHLLAYDGYGDQPIDQILRKIEETGVNPTQEQLGLIIGGIKRFIEKVNLSLNENDVFARDIAKGQLAKFAALLEA